MRTYSRRSQKGFSLVELLIVIAIIGIIAAIAIPSLILAQRRAREASAVNCLRAYSSAQLAFFATSGKYSKYGTTTELSNGFLDPAILADQVRSGYKFKFSLDSTSSSFTANANPLETAGGDKKAFFLDTSGVIRFRVVPDQSVDATASDAPIGGT
jgi:prepilin-type N-terminal cleavage/methylation domain-containing protein